MGYTNNKLHRLNNNIRGGEKKALTPLFQKHLKTKNILSIDVETYGKENTFYSCGIYNEEEFKYFLDKEEAQKYLINETKSNTIIVATNLSFDFTVIFYDSKYWNDFKIIMNQGRMLEAVYQPKSHKKNKLIFLDTLNFAQFSVKVMGEILNIPKLNPPSCLGLIPSNTKEEQEIKIYNKRDCEVTYKFTKLLQEGFNKIGCNMKVTIASTSMDLFRRKYLRFPIIKEKYQLPQSEEVNKMIFNSYYGGRTEVFKRGPIGRMKYYDVNSLYPYAMMEEYPNPNTVKTIYSPKKYVIEFFEGVSDVLIRTNESEYPDLPYRQEMKQGVKLIFPQGVIRGVYTHADLRRAISKGYKVLKIYKSIYYKKTFYPFKDYVMDLYEKRMYYKKRKSPMEIIYKLLLNSLYGKFAQKHLADIKFFDLRYFTDEQMDEFHNSDELETYMNDTYKGFTITKKICNQAHVFPIFSSYTTGHARTIINKHIEDSKAYYSDTDSVVTDKSIKVDTKLGGLKVEHDIISGFLVKPKMYMFDTPEKTIVKLKGVPRVSKEDFLKVINNNSVSYDKFSKLKESIRKNIKPNTIMRMTKTIDLQDNKRKWATPFIKDLLQESMPLKVNHKV